MKKPLVAALLIGAFSLAGAKDFGVQGTVFPVVEIDMRQLFREQLEKADIAGAQEQIRTSGKRYLDNLPKRTLPTLEKTKTAYIDMSVTLTSDIQAPVKQPDGSWKWQVLYPAGTRVNPLDHQRPINGMLFIDGSQPEQVAFAKKMLAVLGHRIYVLEAGQGSIVADNEALDVGTYYGDDRLMARFQVTALPSLLYPGEGENKSYMALTSFGRPFKVEDAMGWSVLSAKLGEKAKKDKKK